jgi:hypothetical protein
MTVLSPGNQNRLMTDRLACGLTVAVTADQLRLVPPPDTSAFGFVKMSGARRVLLRRTLSAHTHY